MNNNNQTNGSNNSFKKKTQGLQDKVSRGIATHLGRKTNSIISNAARDKGKNHGAGGSSLRPVDRDVSKRMQLSKSISRDMNHAARQARRRNDPYKSAMIKSQAAGMGLKLGGVGGSMNLNDARMQEATKNSQMVNQFGQSMASDPAAPAGQGKYDGSGSEEDKGKTNETKPDVISQVGVTAKYADGTDVTQEDYDQKEQKNRDFYDRHKDGIKGALDTSRDKIKSAWDKISGFASDKFSGYASGGKVGYASGGEVAGNGNIPTQPNGDDTLATLKSGEVVLTKEQQAALGGDKALAKAGVPGFGGNPELEQAGGMPAFAGGGEVNPYFNSEHKITGYGGTLFGNHGIKGNLFDGSSLKNPTVMDDLNVSYDLPNGKNWRLYQQSLSGTAPPVELPDLSLDAYSSPVEVEAYNDTVVGGHHGIIDKDVDAQARELKIRRTHDEHTSHVREPKANNTVAEIKKNRKAGKTALGFDRGKNPDGSDRKQWEPLTADEILKAQKSSREHAARNKKLSDLKKDPTYGMDARTKAYFEAPAKRRKAKQAERAARKKESEALKAQIQRSMDIEDLKKTDPEKAMDYMEKYQSNEKVKAGLKESKRIKARDKRLGL